MNKIKYLIAGALISSTLSAFDIPATQDILISGEVKQINMERLLDMTQMIESRGGKDNYKGRVAKTSYQYELETVNHYLSLIPDLKAYVESELGRELDVHSEDDARYVAWLVYMSKLQYHRAWLDKYNKYYKQSGDIEWSAYKVLWNSVKGASTLNKWRQREVELFCMEAIK